MKKESLIAFVLVAATYGSKYFIRKSPVSAWRDDFWDEAFPLIVILLGLAMWHVLKAGYELKNLIQLESLRSIDQFPSVYLPPGHDRQVAVKRNPTVRFYRALVKVAVEMLAGNLAVRTDDESLKRLQTFSSVLV